MFQSNICSLRVVGWPMASRTFRWQTVETDPQTMLFPADELGERHVGTGEFRGLEFFHVNAKSIVNRVSSSSNMPFTHTINAYRGCSHACTYCFARPTHEYLNLGAGEDFDTKIVVKVNAVERLRAEVQHSSWTRPHIAMGTNTDPYQRCEGKYHLTQGIIRVLTESLTPFSILTKSTLILRDLELLQAAAARVPVRVNISIPTLDIAVWKATEPGTPHPQRRIEAVARLNESGIACGVLMAPIQPGLSDSDEQLRAVVDAAVEASAVSIGASWLYLRGATAEHHLQQLASFDAELAAWTANHYSEQAYRPKHMQADLSARIKAMVLSATERFGRVTRVVDSDLGLAERLQHLGLAPALAIGVPQPPSSTNDHNTQLALI